MWLVLTDLASTRFPGLVSLYLSQLQATRLLPALIGFSVGSACSLAGIAIYTLYNPSNCVPIDNSSHHPILTNSTLTQEEGKEGNMVAFDILNALLLTLALYFGISEDTYLNNTQIEVLYMWDHGPDSWVHTCSVSHICLN